MHQPVHFILRERERVAMYGLLSHRTMYHVISWVLHDSHYDRAFAEANILIPYGSRPIAPSAIATEGAAHQSGVNTGVHALDGHIAPAHSYMKVHQEIGIFGIVGFLQALFRQVPLDSTLYFAAQDIAICVSLAGHRFAAPHVVSGNDASRIAMGSLFRGGPPCPRGVASYVDIRVSRYVDVFVASGKQRGACNGTNREKSGSSLDKPLRWHL